MKFINILFKFIFLVVLFNLFILFFKTIKYLLKTFWKVFKIAVKVTLKATILILYYSSRVIAWPIKNCFPPKSINKMSGIDFEDFIAKWLSLNGYRSIKKTPISSDYGIDLLAQKDHEIVGIQCKRYSDHVGVGAIQEVTAGLPYYNCTKGIVITNSFFTPNAKELAEANDIELIDGQKLKESKITKLLTRSYFSIFISLGFVFCFIIFSISLNFWALFNLKSLLPLTVMLLLVLLLTFINGIFELKDRKTLNNEEKSQPTLQD